MFTKARKALNNEEIERLGEELQDAKRQNKAAVAG
jgi:hypothetical protein